MAIERVAEYLEVSKIRFGSGAAEALKGEPSQATLFSEPGKCTIESRRPAKRLSTEACLRSIRPGAKEPVPKRVRIAA